MKKNILFLSSCASLLVITFAINSCKKASDLSLSGTSSVSAFDYTLSPSGIPDTLPFTTKVSFTNKSQEGYLSQWNFGDNTPTSVEMNPVHEYKFAQLYTVTLTSVGTNGNNVSSQRIQINGACSVDVFSKLTGCLKKEWALSYQQDAIQVWSEDSTQQYYSGPPETNCQADDVYTFSNDGTFLYDAKGSTFVANEGPYPYSCQAAQANASSFKLVINQGNFPKIILNADGIAGGRTPFIGTTDTVKDNLYEILSYSDSTMLIRGRLNDNSQLLVKLRTNTGLSLDDIKNLLTSKSWRLDSSLNANPIVVGLEDAPTLYFAGGALTDCQKDDVYTFFTDNTLSYNANGSTFVAGDFTCQDDKSYNHQPYTYQAMTTTLAGIAEIILPNDPAVFLGTTDSPRPCRILSITGNTLVIRAGDGTGTVFTYKFVAK